MMSMVGFQSEKRTIEALPVRIDYQSPRYEHFLRPKGLDCLFSFSEITGQPNCGEIRETTNLDPYAIRAAFEAVNSAESAIRFLSEAGVFWPWRAVTWSQFQEWQRFLSWLRVETVQTPEGQKAWHTASGFENGFFAGTDVEFTRARFQGADIPPMALRENELADHQALAHLRQFAVSPRTSGNASRISLGWYDASDSHAPEDGRGRRAIVKRGGARLEPFLRIEARNILEAIAATIYADKVHGLRHEKCKNCGNIFKLQSDHRQKFCPAPPHLATSTCKNAYLQRERRRKIKEANKTTSKRGTSK